MPSRRDAVARMRNTLSRHHEGVVAALGNAVELLQEAAVVYSRSPAHASFIASIAAEELGKALLLDRRARQLLWNSRVHVYEIMFEGEPDWAPGKHQPNPVLPWGVFAGRRGTHRGGLHDHAAKLQALRDDYERHHDLVIESTTDRIVLASIDVFAGANATAVRQSVEAALYVYWSRSGQWNAPKSCIANVPNFVSAMSQYADDLSNRLKSSHEHLLARLDSLEADARLAGASLTNAFPAD